MVDEEDRRRPHGEWPRWNPGGLVTPSPEEAADPWLGAVFDDRYELVARIGQGGMATVYRARERGLIEREVAIKLLTLASSTNEATVARFRNEAQLIIDIHHPHVVNIHQVGHAPNGQLYIVMELLRGQNLHETLQALLAEGEALPWRRLAPMMLQVCAALQAAHSRKIIHRDIKPSNCFRCDVAGNPDFIKVLDFGIARAERGAAAAATRLTRQDSFLGTPHYAAPEIIDPDLGWPVDGRADMFAVGVMMYQCLTGELPFAGNSDFAVFSNTIHADPLRPRERAPNRAIPPEVDDLVMRTMARRPEARYPDMVALTTAIRAASRERTVLTVGAIDDPPRDQEDEASTVRRPPLAQRSATRRVTRDDSTPQPSPVVTSREPITQPTSLERGPPPPADTRGLAATLALMGLGLLALLVQFGLEFGKPTRLPLPRPPPGAGPLEVAPADDTASTTGAVDPPDVVLVSTTGDAGDDPPPPPPIDRRKPRVDAIVRDLASPRVLLGCRIDVTQRWQLPLDLVIAADGEVIQADARPPASKQMRLRDEEQDCLLRALRTLSFPRGPGVLRTRTTVRGGPP